MTKKNYIKYANDSFDKLIMKSNDYNPVEKKLIFKGKF